MRPYINLLENFYRVDISIESASLSEAMQVVLADTFALYYKTHAFHWNITGAQFPQYHEFFNELYDELWTAIDLIAEKIRTLDAFVIGFDELKELSTIQQPKSTDFPMDSRVMCSQLVNDNNQVIDKLNLARSIAEEQQNNGLLGFIDERLDIHAKHGWMLKSSL